MSTNYGRLCEARDKAHPMTPDTMIEIRAIDLHAVLVDYAVMVEKKAALQAANKDLMEHFEAARADAEECKCSRDLLKEHRAILRDSAKDVIAWCDANPQAGDALYCIARLRHAIPATEDGQ